MKGDPDDKRKNRGLNAGRPVFEPTDAMRKFVMDRAAVGRPQDEICLALEAEYGTPISRPTLRKHFHKELTAGGSTANYIVGKALFEKAQAGDITAMIWWEKTRSGMKDGSRSFGEGEGSDGSAPPLKEAMLSPEERRARLRVILNIAEQRRARAKKSEG